MEQNKDREIIGIIVERLIKSGKTTFTKEDIEEQYPIVLEELRIEKAKKEAPEIYKRKKLEIIRKLEITKSTHKIRTKELYEIELELNRILKDTKIEAYEKNKKIDEIEEKINTYVKDVEELINKYYAVLKNKIQYAKNNYYDSYFMEIYNTKANLTNLEDELELAIYNSTIEEIKNKINQISKKFEDILMTTKKIYNLRNGRNYYMTVRGYTYELNGINITIDQENKKYIVDYKDSFFKRLKDTKIKRIKRFLKERINARNINEIIEPKYVNERSLLNFINNKTIPSQELMRFNYIGLLKFLSLDKIVDEISLEELVLEDSEFSKIYDIIQILNSEGFEQGNKEKFEDKTIKEYKNICLDAKKMYEIISEAIIDSCPNEQYVYSSMQSAYNCIDRTIIRNIDSNDNITKVVEFIRKYSRNSKGEPYTTKEILNFIKQKREIIYPSIKEISIEYPTFNSDINELMSHITGEKKNYSLSTLDDTANVDEQYSIKGNNSKKGRKKI